MMADLPTHLATTEQPRQILAEDFPSLNGGLPIQGGWGYTQNDACIIVKDDPLVEPGLPFDGIAVEYAFVEKRIYEEMIIFRPDGGKFSGMQWELLDKYLVEDTGRYFDHLVFEISAFRDSDWEDLKAEYTGKKGSQHPDFDLEAHELKREKMMVRLKREFWFDITSFYGG